jgi:hypothetical protein
MAYMLSDVKLATVERLGFYVLAPERQIQTGVFGNLVTKESVREKVGARVAQYRGEWDTWLSSAFEPVLRQIDLAVLSWESVLSTLPNDDDATGIREFYSLCQRFNPARGKRRFS